MIQHNVLIVVLSRLFIYIVLSIDYLDKVQFSLVQQQYFIHASLIIKSYDGCADA